jgi:hypothetical protein
MRQYLDDGLPMPPHCNSHPVLCDYLLASASWSDSYRNFESLVNLQAPCQFGCGIDIYWNPLVNRNSIWYDLMSLSSLAPGEHVSRQHPLFLPGRAMFASDTFAAYGFETLPPHSAMLQDITDFIRAVQGVIHATPEWRFLSHIYSKNTLTKNVFSLTRGSSSEGLPTGISGHQSRSLTIKLTWSRATISWHLHS